MVKIESTGIRKINFKDCVQEPLDAGIGSLWEGPIPGDWSTGVGAGAMPSTFQGMGGRHLVTATGAAYSPVYTNDRGAFDWWHTDQRQSGGRYAHQYDFMVRVNTAWPGVTAVDGVFFGYFIEHGGSPGFAETTGYRLRLDGTNLILEKFIAGPGWGTFLNPITSAQTTTPLALDFNKDYYIRITYYPTDLTYIAGNVILLAGAHVISITDDFERRGSDNVFQYVAIDIPPLLGSADTKLMQGGYNGIDAEFDLITYSEGFLEEPAYMHYYSQMKAGSTKLTLKWPKSEQEPFALLKSGDRIEMWCKSRSTTIDTTTLLITNEYNKILCVYDGMVLKLVEDDKDEFITVIVVDEFTTIMGSKREHEDVSQVGGGTYYDYIQSLFAEHQGAIAYFERLTFYSGIDATLWSGVNVSVASWKHRGTWGKLWEILSRIVNCWNYWHPAGAFLISQLAPIATGKVFDFNSSTGEMQWMIGSQRNDTKRDSYANQVNQYHDNGAGVVVVSTAELVADQPTYGVVSVDMIDVNMPAAEGAICATNVYNKMIDKTDIMDIYTMAYGLEFHVGCRVGVKDSSRGFDEMDMTITEVEMFRTNQPEKHNIPTPSSVIRFRLAYQTDPGGQDDALPRCENKKTRNWVTKWKDGEYGEHNWT